MHAVYSYILFFQVEKVYRVSEAVVFSFKMKEKKISNTDIIFRRSVRPLVLMLKE